MSRPAVNVAVRAARAAGQIILRHMNRLESLAVVEKQQLDFVSEVDRMAEAEIIRELKRAYPTARDAGRGIRPTASTRTPGSSIRSTARTITCAAFRISAYRSRLLEHGDPIVGVVFDPLRGRAFTASKGDGAFLNDRRMRVGKRESLAGALLATGFPIASARTSMRSLRMTRALLQEAEDIRRTGSAALDIAYVAAGRHRRFLRNRPQTLGYGGRLPTDPRSRRRHGDFSAATACRRAAILLAPGTSRLLRRW